MLKIQDLLHRRTDLSTFLVHLTRANSSTTARENLMAMITGNDSDGPMAIKARSAFGPGRDWDKHLGTVATQKAVCFSETPLEHVWMMLEPIDGRAVQFEPWGLATTKAAAREAGCSPVWYTNKSTQNWEKNPIGFVRGMITDAVRRNTGTGGEIDEEGLQDEYIFRIAPFVEDMGYSANGVPKAFWWEREWRHVGDYPLTFPSRMVAILVPEAEHKSFSQEMVDSGASKNWLDRPIIDPRWGLERIISIMSGVSPDYMGPFPHAF